MTFSWFTTLKMSFYYNELMQSHILIILWKEIIINEVLSIFQDVTLIYSGVSKIQFGMWPIHKMNVLGGKVEKERQQNNSEEGSYVP